MEQGDYPIWIVRDRWNRDIGLFQEAWYNHILAGHRVLREHEVAVARVLTNPYRVTHDAVYEDRECFYRQRTHPRFPDLFLKVCVEFESEEFGVVITAFLVSRISSDEVQRWP
jgi:hypothetical protein